MKQTRLGLEVILRKFSEIVYSKIMNDLDIVHIETAEPCFVPASIPRCNIPPDFRRWSHRAEQEEEVWGIFVIHYFCIFVPSPPQTDAKHFS